MPTVSLPTGIDMHYEVRGEGDPIVMAPATGFAGDIWDVLYDITPLSERYKVVTFDQRGSGKSTRYQGVYTIEQMAIDIYCLIDHLELPPVHFVGHSMGGRMGLELALDFPRSVRSLVLAATGSGVAGHVGGPETVSGLTVEFVEPLVRLGFEDYLRHEIFDSEVYFTPAFRAQHRDKVEEYFEVAMRGVSDCPEYIRQVMARQTWEATHRLGEVQVPVLSLVGELDTVHTHVEQAEAFRKIPDVELQKLEGQTHSFFWEEPGKTNAILLDWFGRH